MKKAKYICIEGVEGVGKTSQILKLKESLESQGYKVILTKEPGTDRVPLTQQLRAIGLDANNSHIIKGLGREFIWQSIRAIHLNNDVYPNLSEVDFIIQDRGIASGLAYGMSFGMDEKDLEFLNNLSVRERGLEHGISHFGDLYDHVIFFKTDKAAAFLEKAKNAKQEFEAGDGIEAEGAEFMETVLSNFAVAFTKFKSVHEINVEAAPGQFRPFDEIHNEVLRIVCSKT